MNEGTLNLTMNAATMLMGVLLAFKFYDGKNYSNNTLMSLFNTVITLFGVALFSWGSYLFAGRMGWG